MKCTKERPITMLDYIAFALAAVAGIIPQYLLSSFASAYYTDVALVSAGAIGTIILVMRITDGISDLIMGRIIDRTNTRWGKCRPWMFSGVIGLVITSLAIFHAPDAWSESGKLVWFAVTYFLMMVVFATMNGVASTTIMIYLSHKPQERTRFGAFNMLGTYVGGIIATTLTTVLLGMWGYTQSGYDKTILLYTVIILVAGIFSTLRLKEHHSGFETAQQDKKNAASVRTVLRAMLKNKYYMCAVIAGLLINLTNGITTGMGVYFCRDIFGNADLYALITIITLFPTLLGLPFAVMLAKKLGNYKTLAYGRVGYMVSLVLSSLGLATANSAMYLLGQGLCGLCGATFAACFTATLANTVDYGEYRFGTNASGTLMSATSFCNKVGLGLGSAVTGLVLTMANYSGELANAGLAQSAYTVAVERWAMILLPLAMNILVTICLFICNVDKKMPAVQAAHAEKEHG